MPDFIDSTDESARLDFLYERIYQRPPSPEETELGLEFVDQTPLRDPTFVMNAGPGQGKPGKPGAKPGKQRAPLTSWEEFAQALLQANETSFVN
jgi:hypothetical protein